MHYDFIEIGAFCHDTLADTATPNTRGLLIEPVQEYLDRIKLDRFPLITKVSAAIVDVMPDEPLLLYYVPEEKVKQHRLHSWMTQCNSIGKPHPWHVRYYANQDGTGECTRLLRKGIVHVREVDLMTWSQLVTKYDVTSLDFLKIDAEGFDCRIVNSVLDHGSRPPKIQFETNGTCPFDEVEETKQRMTSLGYVHRVDGANTISTLV